MSSLVKGIATYYTTPLGAFAIGAIIDLMVPKLGEDVSYGLADETDKNLFMASQQDNYFFVVSIGATIKSRLQRSIYRSVILRNIVGFKKLFFVQISIDNEAISFLYRHTMLLKEI